MPKKYAYQLWYRTKARAKKKGLAFGLSREFVENVILNGKCSVTGIKFNKKASSKKYGAFTASIDRINPKLGYTEDNCQVVCWIYNRAKGNGTHKEVLILAEALMPSKNLKQHRFMEAVAHNSKFAKKAGVPQSVGKDFAAADKGKSFNKGGEVKDNKLKTLFKGKDTVKEEVKEAKAIKSSKISPMQYAKGEESEKQMKKSKDKVVKPKFDIPASNKSVKMKNGGLAASKGDGVAQRGKTSCKVR